MAGNESNEPGHEIPDVNACTKFGRGHQTQDYPAGSAFLSSVMGGVADTVHDALDGS
ncbi:MAG: hypothetical protein ACXVYY_18820 [Oryzihumus sp.]